MNEGEMIEAASRLTAKISWARKYRQNWLLLRHYSEEALQLLDETDKPDRAASDFLNSMRELAFTKVAKLDIWLKAKESEQNKLMEGIDPDVAINR